MFILGISIHVSSIKSPNRSKVSGILASPLIWLMGKTTDILLLSVFTIAAWFIIGIGGIQIWNLAGLFSNESERGKNFGIFASTGPLGAMIGGLLFGFIADKGVIQ